MGILIASFVTVLSAGMLSQISGAQALPAAFVQAPGAIIKTADGCGFGWHRGPYGGCRRNAAVVVPPLAVAPPGVVYVRPPRVVPAPGYVWR